MDKKTKLLEASIKIFARAGYGNASVDEIVETAGVAKGTFYYYFKSKEDLFLSLIGNGIKNLSCDMLAEVSKYDKATDQISAIIASQYKFFVENHDLCRVLLSEIWRFESKWKQRYIPSRNQYIEALEKAISTGQDDYEFSSNLDPVVASAAIFGMVATSALDNIITGKHKTKATVQMITNMAIGGLKNN